MCGAGRGVRGVGVKSHECVGQEEVCGVWV